MAEQFCRNCGTPLRETDNFCPNCGTRVLREASAPAAEEHAQESVKAEETAAQQAQTTEAAEEVPIWQESEDHGADKIMKNRRAYNIEDFDWGTEDYPTGKRHKTEDIDFNWKVPVPEAEEARNPSRPADEESEAEAVKSSDSLAEDIPTIEMGETSTVASGNRSAEADLGTIDDFYTYSQKNEEFQKVLNQEYDRLHKEAPHPEDMDASERRHHIDEPEQALKELEELTKKAMTLTAASSAAAEAANELYGGRKSYVDEKQADGDGAGADGSAAGEVSAAADAAIGEAGGAGRTEGTDASVDTGDGADGSESAKTADESGAGASADVADGEGAGAVDADGAVDAGAADSEKAGGASELSSADKSVDYVFNPEATKKQHRKKRHILLKLLVTIIVLLIIVEVVFLILRSVAPDSPVSIQLEKIFMAIADFIYHRIA